MLSIRSSRPRNVMFFVAILTVIVAGCGSGTVSPGVTSAPSTTSTTPATTASPTTTASPASPATTASPTTVSQATWIAGVTALRKKMNAAVGTSGSGIVTSKWMRDASKKLGGCTADLSRLGPATDDVDLIFEAAKQGCAKYQEAAKCLASGNPDTADLDKCFAAINKGEEFLSTAAAMAEILH
jgi:hypothetical protein